MISLHLRFPKTILVALLLVTSIWFAYWSALRSDFVIFDDDLHVVHNPQVNPPSWSGLVRTWVSPQQRLYIPATYTVWTFLAWLHQPLSPALFHGANLLLHTFSSLLLYFIILVSVRKRFAAVGGAAVFALHPLQVEAVVWVSGLKDTLCVFFSLIALVSYWFHLKAEPGRAWRWLVAGMLSTVLALLSKPSAVILPVWIALFAITVWNRKVLPTLRDLGPWALASLPFTAVTLRLQRAELLEFTPPDFFGRAWVAFDAISFYLRQIVWPVSLAIDYGRSPQRVCSLSGMDLTWSFLSFVGIAGVLLLAVKRRDWPLGLLSLVPVVPVLGLRPFVFQNISTVADRYFSLSLVGVGVVTAFWIASASRFLQRLSVIVVIGLGALTVRQVGYWKDSQTLLLHATKVNPRSWLAYNNLGVAYEEEGRWEDSLQALEKSAQLRPHPTTFSNMGAVQMKLGRYAQAIASYEQALKYRPQEKTFLNNIGVAYLGLGKEREAHRYLFASRFGPSPIAQTQRNRGIN